MSLELIASVAGHFDISGNFLHARQFGSGHINETFLAVYDEAGSEASYVIQRINHSIFKDPQALMDNMVLVTNHIRGKLIQRGESDIHRKVVEVIPAVNGNNFVLDDSGNYWRALKFIAGASTFDVCPSLEHIYRASEAFGNFQVMLSDLPADDLKETIPDFHNSPKRLDDLKKALGADRCDRVCSAEPEIKFILGHCEIFGRLAKLVEGGDIPLRIAHNDTKINNVMFDDTSGEALCVIDLDTVMPGLSLSDFGDIVRTTVSDAEEDEQDLSKVTLDISRFEAIVRGYLASAGKILNKAEKDSLLVGAKNIILEQAVRFLTDHLEGDTYYKTHRPNHNLDRCRTQIRLFELVLKHEKELNEIINAASSGQQRN
ncbi:MAG: aminoglycoside phosphotransferase family protein [Planctomycetes bacterium]|nr:aminoglycoside phosphotransferase family protein [Planctomycetota bacterium]